MGEKVMWGGLTLILALSHFWALALIVGAVIMPVGYVLYLFEK